MPRAAMTEDQKSDQEMRRLIESKMALTGIQNKEALAKRINMPFRTFYRKWKSPGTFQRSEIRAICKVLKMTETEKAAML